MSTDRFAAAEQIVGEIFTRAGRSDPYPLYHRLREIAPIHRSEVAHAWLLTRYDDCQAVLRDPRLGRGWAPFQDVIRPGWRARPALTRIEKSMLMTDGPAHTRLRKLVSRAFTAKTVEAMRPAVQRMVDDLVTPLTEKGGGELMAELAFPLPAQVVAHLVGVPPSDVEPFRTRAQILTAIFEIDATAEMLDASDRVQKECDAYFEELIAHKRRHPGEDLISALIAVEEGGDRLATDELSYMAMLLFIAGFETTTNMIGNSALAFAAHPEQVEALRRQPELYRNLSMELLRYDSTVHLVNRGASEEIELAEGMVVAPGDHVFALAGAANRDPARFPDPDRLDVTRADVKPISFGGGPHYCIGAALARLELEVVFATLFDRFDRIEIAGEFGYRDRLTLRGPFELPVTLMPRQKAAPVTAIGLRPTGDDMAWRQARRTRMEQTPHHDGPDLDALIELIARVGFFERCSRPELTSLAATAYPIAFDPGDTVISIGTDAEECYVIAEGEARVVPEGRPAATIGADDVVGERGPLLGLPRSATVTAETHLVAYAISRRRLADVIEANPAAAEHMREFVRSRQGEAA